jgi:hypothetical protein
MLSLNFRLAKFCQIAFCHRLRKEVQEQEQASEIGGVPRVPNPCPFQNKQQHGVGPFLINSRAAQSLSPLVTSSTSSLSFSTVYIPSGRGWIRQPKLKTCRWGKQILIM